MQGAEALMQACREGRTEDVKMMLVADADIAAQDDQVRTLVKCLQHSATLMCMLCCDKWV